MSSDKSSLIWLIMISLIIYLGYQFTPHQMPESKTLSNVGTEVSVRADLSGHFIFHGQINGSRVNFLYDTGATLVSIPEKIANELGLQKGRRAEFSTANGKSIGYLTVLREVKVGDITMRNVPASISTGLKGNKILLGMSFLNNVESTRYKGQLTLRVRE